MKKMAVIRQSLKFQADFFSIWDDLEDDDKLIKELWNDIRKLRNKLKVDGK